MDCDGNDRGGSFNHSTSYVSSRIYLTTSGLLSSSLTNRFFGDGFWGLQGDPDPLKLRSTVANKKYLQQS